MNASSSSERTTPKSGDEVEVVIRGTYKDYGDGFASVIADGVHFALPEAATSARGFAITKRADGAT